MSDADPIDVALEHHRAGRLAEAAAVYERILQSAPRHADALHLLGVIAYQAGDHDRAIDLIRRAIAVAPNHMQSHNMLGLALMRRGELDQAMGSFRNAIALEPGAQVYNNLGTALKQQGRLEEAVESYRQALALDPKYANACYNLGNARRAMNDREGAVECFRGAIAIEPDHADALASLGEVLRSVGQPKEAAEALRKAAKLLPRDPTLHCELGDALQALGELEEAKACYQQAISLDRELHRAWCAMGRAEAKSKEYAAAIPCFQRALAVAPDDPEAHYHLGEALFSLGQVDPGLTHFRKAASLAPSDLTLSAIAMLIPGSSSADNRAVLDARRAWAERVAPADPPDKTFVHRPAADDAPLRVGYVSAFFQASNWMKPVWGLLNRHDRERFEIHLFSHAPESRIKHGRRRDPRDRFHDVTGLSNDQVAYLIEENQVDILVDLNGYSAMERLPLFALRPAPVIVAWFNMYATTGMACFDYLIGDEYVIPVEEEAFYTETIIRVPGCYLTFEVTYPVPEVASPPCLQNKAITFGCLASQYKITTDVLEAWSKILHRCPDSRLILKNADLGSPRNREFVLARLAEFQTLQDRVELDGPADHFNFLKKYDEIDVALDTFPYNGGTTTIEALWQGVPVLTFYGDRWAARQSSSLLRNASLPEFVARNLNDYIDRAVNLACSPDTPAKLAELRRDMRSRLRQGPVCDTETFTRCMEREYLRMWHQKREREGARHI